MITVHKTKLIEIGARVELLIGYDENIERFPLAKEEMHGIHLINEDTSTFILTSVEIVIGSHPSIDILGQLTYPMKEEIINLLQY